MYIISWLTRTNFFPALHAHVVGTVNSVSYAQLCNPLNRIMPGSLSCTMSQNLLRFMSIEVVVLSNHFISAAPFSFCLQSFPASRSFPMSWFFTSGGKSIEASASASVLPKNIQGWFPLGLTAWISFQSKELSRVFSNTTVQKHQFFSTQP